MAASKTRKLHIDFGLAMEFNVPEDVSDEEACGAIFAAVGGKGDPRDGINMKADVAYHVGCQLSANLKAGASLTMLDVRLEIDGEEVTTYNWLKH